MKKTCNSQVQHTCASKNYAVCINYEGTVNTQSELIDEPCLNIEETTQDIYNQLEEIDLSALGEQCLEYVETEEGKIIVKNVLLKHEEEICLLKDRVTELENRQFCNTPISDCVDTSCLVDPCGDPITTWGQLVQILINNACPTP